MRFSVAFDDDGTACVHLQGEIDCMNVATLELLLEGLQLAGATAVRLDASGLAFADGATLRVLLTASEVFAANGGRLVVTNAHGPLLRLLDLFAIDLLEPVEHPRETGDPGVNPTSR